MKFSYDKLRGKIVEKYGSEGKFAEAVGVHINTISRKLNNKTRFSSDDVVKMTKLLDIPQSDITEYFFTQRV